MLFFASDNNSGAHPIVLDALNKANAGNTPSYGSDPWTAESDELIQKHFGKTANAWYALTGTAANVLGLRSMLRSYEGVICPETAHINNEECGSAECVVGCKLLKVPAFEGKIHLTDCSKFLAMRESVHHTFPRVLSITQLTECGTAYTLDELRKVGEYCKTHNLYYHLDGARLSNAAAYLGVSLKEITADIGVDVLSFGGSKNGLAFGEAVIFFNDELGYNFGHYRKQHAQLISKMRYVSAQFIAYLTDDLWRKNAEHANKTAQMLASAIQNMEHARLVYPVQGNMVFARMHKNHIARLSKNFFFYTISTEAHPDYPEDWHLIRLLTSFNTPEQDVETLIKALQNCAQ